MPNDNDSTATADRISRSAPHRLACLEAVMDAGWQVRQIHDLKASARAVLAALAWSAPRAYPSYETIQKRTSYSRRTVQDALDELEKAGLIEIYERQGEHWTRRPPPAPEGARSRRPRGPRQLGFVLTLPGLSRTLRPDFEEAA